MKKLREKCKNKKGFTMVELIVVIVIILVLAAVLVPSLLKYVDKANQANCKADAATILSQLQADYADYMSSTTGATAPNEVSGVTVTLNTGGDVSSATVNQASYYVTNNEITSFAYNNGKYTAIWRKTAVAGTPSLDAGWNLIKN